MSAWHEIIGASTYAYEILDCLVNAPRIELTGESLRRIFVKPSDQSEEETHSAASRRAPALIVTGRGIIRNRWAQSRRPRRAASSV
jgi:hypothetical protein